jgi:prepilin-type N-terminal cleavage/methylation domain-containing protein
MRTKRRGFSLIEALIALAIIGAAIAIGLAYHSKVEYDSRMSGTVSAVSNMTSKIRVYYASVGSYNGLDQARVNVMGLMMPPLIWDGAAIRDPWGHNVNVLGNIPNAAPAFAIKFGEVGATGPSGVPLTFEECVSLATQLAGGADRVNVGEWTVVGVGGGQVSGGKAYKAAGNVLSMANLTDAAGCGAANPAVALQYH